MQIRRSCTPRVFPSGISALSPLYVKFLGVGHKHHYPHGLIDKPFKKQKKYDVIVVAILHKEFKVLNMDDYQKISNGMPVIIDIKGIGENTT